jgi:hypothetical protein
MDTQIKIGTNFIKQISKHSKVECEVVDIIQRLSTKSGNIAGIEYWAKSDKYGMNNSFEVSKTTILRGL